MGEALSPALGPLVQSFFCRRLLAQQHASAHTVSSYRDTIRLLLAFVQKQRGRDPTQQTWTDWNASTILAFLDYLEQERGCQARTRNARLAALRAFTHYVAQQAPETLDQAGQILAIPLKRYDRRLVEPLSPARSKPCSKPPTQPLPAVVAIICCSACSITPALGFPKRWPSGKPTSAGDRPVCCISMAKDAKNGPSLCSKPSASNSVITSTTRPHNPTR